MQNIKKFYPYDEVLLIYRCGSSAFGIITEKSDLDYVVVLKDFKGTDHITEGGNEYFIFGTRQWISKMEFENVLPNYYMIFNDESLAFPKNVDYLSEEFKITFEKYKNRDFKLVYKKWLELNIEYFDYYLTRGVFTKTMYHLFRIEYMIKNYKESDSLSLELSNEIKDLIFEYKTSEDFKKYKDKLLKSFDYLKQELKE